MISAAGSSPGKSGRSLRSSSGTSGRFSAVSAASALSEVSWLSMACLRRFSRSCSWRICRRRQANSWRARSSMVTACCWARSRICSASAVASSFTRSASASESRRSSGGLLGLLGQVLAGRELLLGGLGQHGRVAAAGPPCGPSPARPASGCASRRLCWLIRPASFSAAARMAWASSVARLDQRAARSPRTRSSRPRPPSGRRRAAARSRSGSGSDTCLGVPLGLAAEGLQLVQLGLPHLVELRVSTVSRTPVQLSLGLLGQLVGVAGCAPGHVTGLLLGHPEDLLGPVAEAGEVGWSRHRHRLVPRGAQLGVLGLQDLAPPLELIEVGLDLPRIPVDDLALVAPPDELGTGQSWTRFRRAGMGSRRSPRNGVDR